MSKEYKSIQGEMSGNYGSEILNRKMNEHFERGWVYEAAYNFLWTYRKL